MPSGTDVLEPQLTRPAAVTTAVHSRVWGLGPSRFGTAPTTRPVTDVTLVVADGHPVLCDGLSSCLENAPGLRVLGTATTLLNLERLVGGHRPRLLVLGESFAGVTSADVVARLKKVQPSLVVVALVGDGRVCDVGRLLAAGCSAFVLKRAPLDELVTAISWASRGEMWASPSLLPRLIDDVGTRARGTRSSGRLAALSARELEVLRLMTDGLDNSSIAGKMYLSLNTVRTHARNIQRKLTVRSNVAAVAVALEEGLTPEG
jgi:DNA-binding NarL/FixJ family response regulator